jgi:hypothetical protein
MTNKKFNIEAAEGFPLWRACPERNGTGGEEGRTVLKNNFFIR